MTQPPHGGYEGRKEKTMFDILDNALNAFNTAMDSLDDNMKLALTFTLLDTASAKLNTTTLKMLEEYMPIIRDVNEQFGTL